MGPDDVCARYLELADRHVPGLVEGLYLQGSIALGDHRPGVSDIDAVVLTAGEAGPQALRRLHSRLPREFTGIYVTRDELRADPDGTRGPAFQGRRVEPASRFERNLVTWHVLRQGGVAVRGPATAELTIHTDWPALARRTEENLRTYWAGWLAGCSRPLTLPGLGAMAPSLTSWGVLGVTRLRHTLAAGEVTSKTAAAAFALSRYDERWHPIVREALRARVGGAPVYRDPLRRRRDLLGYVAAVVDGRVQRPVTPWS
jgi:hypothetical protein